MTEKKIDKNKRSKPKSDTELEIKRITRQIVKNYKPEKIILFGSYAWGKPTKDSDVDLFIVKRTKKSRGERLLEVEKMLLDRVIPLDILVYTQKEIEDRLLSGDFFIEDIIKKGQLIYAEK